MSLKRFIYSTIPVLLQSKLMLLVKKDLVPHCIQIFSYSTGTMSAITCGTHNPLTRTPLNKRTVTYTVNNILPALDWLLE